MDSAFLSAPQKHTCLRLRLEPLTLGHLFLLREYEIDLDNPTSSDLILGVFICSSSQAQARHNLAAWWAGWFMTCLGFFCRKLKPVDEAEKFAAYIADGLRCPQMHSFRNGPSRKLGAPDEWRLLVMLEVDFHKSCEQALGMTMREILCRWATEMDRQGKQALMSDEERAFWDYAQQCDRQKFTALN